MKQLTFIFAFICSINTFAYDPTAKPPMIDLDAIENTINPCDNFYQYACGHWLNQLQLPEDKSYFSHQSTALEEEIKLDLKSILEKQGRSNNLGQFYQSCQSQSQQYAENQNILRELAEQIVNIKSKKQFITKLAEFHDIGIDGFWSLFSYQDFNDSKSVIAFLTPSGFSLPSRDYYMHDDEATKTTRKKYFQFIRNIIQEMNDLNIINANDLSEKDRLLIWNLERTIAIHTLSLEEQWDPSIVNHRMKIQDLINHHPQLQLKAYFAQRGLIDGQTTINNNEPDYLKHIEQVFTATNLKDLKKYLIWQLMSKYAQLSSQKSNDLFFNFWSVHLSGVSQRPQLWKKCLSATESNLSDDLGEFYIQNAHNADLIKKNVQQLIEDFQKMYWTRMAGLDWLDQTTRMKAQEKVLMIARKIAFPNEWHKYSGQKLSENYLLNLIEIKSYESKKDVNKINKPLDRQLWGMGPWEINAYYDPSLNEIVFPYAILLNPVYDMNESLAANLGALGATVGHELSHGFDTDGSQYDGYGNAKNWWSENVQKNFETKSQCYIQQANQYEILPNIFVNGERTITENIADQGGTRVAYELLKSKKSQNLSIQEQKEFFLSYAQSWCTKVRDEAMLMQINTDTHPPEEFRVNSVMMNMPEFSQVYQCQEGVDKMAPKVRCHMW